MTTKEKTRRKQAAKRHRIETPAVIVLPVRQNKESEDLMNAAIMKADIMTEENPSGTSLPVIDDAPLIGEPITDAPQRSPTNEELAVAMQQAVEAGELDHDPFEVWFVEQTDKVRNWITSLPDKIKAAHDALITGWVSFNNAVDRRLDTIETYLFNKKKALKDALDKQFAPKVTRDELLTIMTHLGEYIRLGNEELSKQITSKNTVDTGRIDSLLFAVKANQKVRAVKLYASLTGADLIVSKQAIEALA